MKAATYSSNAAFNTLTIGLKEGTGSPVTHDGIVLNVWNTWGVIIYKRADDTNLTIEVNFKPGYGSEGGKHYALLMDDFHLEYISEEDAFTASSSNTIDFSDIINNAGIYNHSNQGTMPRGWTASQHTTGNGNYTEGANGDTRLEGWSGSNLNIDYNQTITNLPAGTYTVTANAHERAEVGKTYIYASTEGQDDATGLVNSATDTDITTSELKVSNGTMKFGIRSTANDWVTADNFRISFLGFDIDAVKSDYETAYSNAISARDDAEYTNIIGTERSTLEGVITTYTTDITQSYSWYVGAKEALESATAAFIDAKPAYMKFEAEKDRALAIGVVVDDIVRPVSGSDSDLETAIHALYVLEDVATNSGYAVDATDIFGSWTQQNTATNSGQHWSGDNGRSYIDKWSGNGFTMSVTNTVTLPAGKYVFKAAARAALGGVWDDALTMQVTGQPNAIFNPQGDSGKGIDTSGAVNYGDGTFANNNGRGWEWRFIPFTLDEPSSVTMKVEAIVKGGNWASFSDITLLTTDDNIGICQMLWSDAKDAAEAAYNNGDYAIITGKERTDLEDAITATNTEPNTSADYQTQTAALNSTKEIFISAKGTYEEYAQESVIATALGVDVPAINSSTTTAATLISNMQTMNVSNYAAANTNYTYDATSLLGAWTNAPGYNHGESWNGTTGDGSDEYYDLYNSGARAMTQTTTLPKAKYVLIAKGRASVNGRLTLTDGTNTVTFPHKSSTGKGITTTGDANFGEGTYANEDNGRGWEYRFLTFESDGNAATTLTFNWTTADYNWAGLDDITLLAIPETVTMKETENYTPVNSIADVALTRTIKGEGTWNTFCVPFDMTAAEIADQLGATAEVKELTGASKSGDNYTMTFSDASSIEAGKPYMVKVPTEVTSISLSNKTISSTITPTTVNGVTFTGVYTNGFAPQGSFIISNNVFYKVDSDNVALKAFRGYITVDSGLPVKALNFYMDEDDATGIESLTPALSEGEEAIYNVAGQRMSKMQKGINIVNGKKVLF